jgi:hypothetical protein
LAGGDALLAPLAAGVAAAVALKEKKGKTLNKTYLHYYNFFQSTFAISAQN